MKLRVTRRAALGLIAMSGIARAVPESPLDAGGADPARPARFGLELPSLSVLRVEALRKAGFGSALRLEERRGTQALHEGAAARPWHLASYVSEGLRVLTRIDLPPGPMPRRGYPVVVFMHGWVGERAAPAFDFCADPQSDYGRMIDAFVDAGFAVLTPGFRGHGSTGGRVADGLEYLAAWDNGSYVSPTYYALDVLNLIEGLGTFGEAGWPRGASGLASVPRVDTQRVHLIGHSQGGDVALIVFACSGHGSPLRNPARAASIWSGTFVSRLTQLASYNPMERCAQAFLAGDGSWNGTAIGSDGAVNPDFVFGYPPDWIEDPWPAHWTWQKETWSLPGVEAALREKLDEMYGTFNRRVDDLRGATYELRRALSGGTEVFHDPRVVAATELVGAYSCAHLLSKPLALHHSDRDFYSIPEWNADLCARINRAGGACRDVLHASNTHSLRVSRHAWFSTEGAREGFAAALAADIAMFRSRG